MQRRVGFRGAGLNLRHGSWRRSRPFRLLFQRQRNDQRLARLPVQLPRRSIEMVREVLVRALIFAVNVSCSSLRGSERERERERGRLKIQAKVILSNAVEKLHQKTRGLPKEGSSRRLGAFILRSDFLEVAISSLIVEMDL